MVKIKEFFKNNYKDIFKPIAVLLSICIIIPLALSITNTFTIKKIESLEEKSQQENMSRLIKADDFEEVTYDHDGIKDKYYVALTKSKIKGYIFITSENGYGGADKVMTAINPTGTVKAVAILDVSNETPGLGQNAAKESFYSQFTGKKSDISVVKNGANEDKNEINAVTGATITSTAVTRAVNKALDSFDDLDLIEESSEN